MSLNKKQSEQLVNSQKWELLKSNALQIESLLLHSPFQVFTVTTNTINAGRPGLKGIKMWRTPSGYLLEYKGQKQLIECGGVAKCILAADE